MSFTQVCEVVFSGIVLKNGEGAKENDVIYSIWFGRICDSKPLHVCFLGAWGLTPIDENWGGV